MTLFAVLLLNAGQARAEVKLPPHFSDHMVLQRDTRVPVWGTAAPGEGVAVKFAGQTKQTTAGPDGRWRVYLDSSKTSAESRIMTVVGSAKTEEVRFADVLVGEVWLCSGQSNMDFTVAKTEKYYFAGVTNEAAEVAAANYPLIRMFTGKWTLKYEPQAEVAGAWKVATPENVREFSAAGAGLTAPPWQPGALAATSSATANTTLPLRAQSFRDTVNLSFERNLVLSVSNPYYANPPRCR